MEFLTPRSSVAVCTVLVVALAACESVARAPGPRAVSSGAAARVGIKIEAQIPDGLCNPKVYPRSSFYMRSAEALIEALKQYGHRDCPPSVCFDVALGEDRGVSHATVLLRRGRPRAVSLPMTMGTQSLEPVPASWAWELGEAPHPPRETLKLVDDAYQIVRENGIQAVFISRRPEAWRVDADGPGWLIFSGKAFTYICTRQQALARCFDGSSTFRGRQPVEVYFGGDGRLYVRDSKGKHTTISRFGESIRVSRIELLEEPPWGLLEQPEGSKLSLQWTERGEARNFEPAIPSWDLKAFFSLSATSQVRSDGSAIVLRAPMADEILRETLIWVGGSLARTGDETVFYQDLESDGVRYLGIVGENVIALERRRPELSTEENVAAATIAVELHQVSNGYLSLLSRVAVGGLRIVEGTSRRERREGVLTSSVDLTGNCFHAAVRTWSLELGGGVGRKQGSPVGERLSIGRLVERSWRMSSSGWEPIVKCQE